MFTLTKAFMALLLIVTFVGAQSAPEYFQQANEAYAKKDYALNVQLLEKAIAAGADHPTVLYYLARGHALTGNAAAAVTTLNKLASQGLSYKPEEDSEFKTIHRVDTFLKVVERFRSNLKPVQTSKPAITLQDLSIIPEGITYDSQDDTFYFGDISRPRIVSYKNGKFHEFSNPADGLWSILGMKIDSSSRTLWATSSGLSGDEKGKSGLFQYDLKEHKLLNKYTLPEGNHGLGEVVVDSRGTVYASDSVSPAIYFVNQGKLELFVGPEPFRSPQGICLSADEKILFVADYSRGLFAIDLSTRKHWKLNKPEGTTTLAGIDGLYHHKKSLIAIQNGIQPNRVLKIFVSADHTRVDRVDVLESNHEIFPEPTLGVVVNNDFYYIGNSMIGPYLEDPKVALKPAIILKLGL